MNENKANAHAGLPFGGVSRFVVSVSWLILATALVKESEREGLRRSSQGIYEGRRLPQDDGRRPQGREIIVAILDPIGRPVGFLQGDIR